MRQRVQLIHWNAAEARERVERLRAAGYDAAYHELTGPDPDLRRQLRKNPLAAFVIDLGRLPSHGRDVALTLRQRKATRHVPLVFVEGEPEKVARIRQLLPDAVYASWSGIRGALKRAIARPPAQPVVPASALAGYSGTPLPKKLGIKANSVVALVGAPKDFGKTLGVLPDGVRLRAQDRGRCDLTIWFVRSREELRRRIKAMATLAGDAPLWMAWKKQASGVATDVNEPHVREVGLAAGLVDYKICAIDATWSGLLFRRRKPK